MATTMLAREAVETRHPSVPGAEIEPRRVHLPFRRDVQGLRALAVGLVVLYHVGTPGLPGGFVGVDVFFVISGFLITGLLIKEAGAANAVSLTGFYARRAKRILPAAGIVLLATLVATVCILPSTRWEAISLQAAFASLFVVNWTFAFGAVDYLQANAAASPLQHFWTLAVEEQFYLIWPLLLLLLTAASRSRVHRLEQWRTSHARRVRLYTVGILAILVPSLAWSVFFTAANPGEAYFVTTTRLWELSIGALVAVLARPLAQLPRALALILGLIGVVVIGLAAVTLSASSPFPSFTALIPTGGAALVIIAGLRGGRPAGIGWVLSQRPFTFIGDVSYSLYLWHWPLVVFTTYLLGSLTVTTAIGIVLVSVLLAWGSYRFVERPAQRSPFLRHSNIRTALLGLALTAVLLTVSTVTYSRIHTAALTSAARSLSTTASTGSGGTAALIGARLLATTPSTGQASDSVGSYSPSAADAKNDNPTVYTDGCHRSFTQSDPVACVYGDRESAVRVALVGDSHAAQWVPAMQALAIKYGWRLETYTKSSCPFADVPIVLNKSDSYPSCTEWNRRVMQTLLSEKPTMVFTSDLSHRPLVDGVVEAGTRGQQLYGAGLRRTWQQLSAAQIPVEVMIDTPYAPFDVPDCVASHENALKSCAFSRAAALSGHGVVEKIGANGLSNVSLLDLNSWICPESTCAAIIGHVLVYRDETHLTATYVRTLADQLGSALRSSSTSPKSLFQ